MDKELLSLINENLEGSSFYIEMDAYWISIIRILNNFKNYYFTFRCDEFSYSKVSYHYMNEKRNYREYILKNSDCIELFNILDPILDRKYKINKILENNQYIC